MDPALENSFGEGLGHEETSTPIYKKDCIISVKITLPLLRFVLSLPTNDNLKFEAAVNENEAHKIPVSGQLTNGCFHLTVIDSRDALFCRSNDGVVACTLSIDQESNQTTSLDSEPQPVSSVGTEPTGFIENSFAGHNDSLSTESKPLSSIASGQTLFKNFLAGQSDTHPYMIKKETKTLDEILSFAPPSFVTNETQSNDNVQDAWDMFSADGSLSKQEENLDLNDKFLKHCKSAEVHLKKLRALQKTECPTPQEKSKDASVELEEENNKSSEDDYIELSSDDDSNCSEWTPTKVKASKTKSYPGWTSPKVKTGKSKSYPELTATKVKIKARSSLERTSTKVKTGKTKSSSERTSTKLETGKTKSYREPAKNKLETEIRKKVQKKKTTNNQSESPHRCVHCKQTFDTPVQLKKHIESMCHVLFPQLRSKFYYCEDCSFKTRFKEDLDEHIKIHPRGIKSHLCEICGLKCRSRSSICMHRRIAHGLLKPLPDYTCRICGKTYYQKAKHRIHELRHTGEKPEMCDLCGKRFWTKNQLNYHVRGLHQGHFRYRCDKCGHGVHKLSYLKTHICGRTRKRRTWTNQANVATPAKDVHGEGTLTSTPHSGLTNLMSTPHSGLTTLMSNPHSGLTPMNNQQ